MFGRHCRRIFGRSSLLSETGCYYGKTLVQNLNAKAGIQFYSDYFDTLQIDTVGGCSVLLGLIAMAQDVECLYAGVKALVCVVRSNKAAQAEMDRRKGYQTLAMLLKRKKQLLNSHILHLIFGLVGTVDSQKETSSIPNLTAFQVCRNPDCYTFLFSFFP